MNIKLFFIIAFLVAIVSLSGCGLQNYQYERILTTPSVEDPVSEEDSITSFYGFVQTIEDLLEALTW